jgi:signal transduction histidine kinase
VINGHEPSLRLLIRNLLTNAISYTPAGGQVSISLAKQEQSTVLVVEDSGPGILEEDRKRVIERFYRVNNHQAPGCGIGLSIVDRVVQMHQGSLRLSQADSGQGLKVVIQL